MTIIKRTNAEPLRKLIQWVTPSGDEILRILDGLALTLELDTDEERILFQARENPNVIKIGLRCTYRLHAHAYAYAVSQANVLRRDRA